MWINTIQCAILCNIYYILPQIPQIAADFFSSTEIIMNWTWIIQKFLYQKQLIQQIPLGFAAFVMKWRKNFFCPQIPQICTDSLRMIRTKSDRGGRFRDRNHTSDRSDMTNEFVNVWPVGRWPMVRNTISSSVQFHSSHPSVHVVHVLSPTSYESGKAERFVLFMLSSKIINE